MLRDNTLIGQRLTPRLERWRSALRVMAWLRGGRSETFAFSGTLSCIIGVLVLIGLALHLAQFKRLQAIRASGAFNTISGTVIGFSGGGSNSPETFSVGGRHFDVWPALVSEGFNTRTIDGGPDLSGKTVEIGYTEHGEIVLLLVATDVSTTEQRQR